MRGVFLPLLLVALAGCGSLRRPGENAEASWYPEQLLTLEERQQEAVIKLTRVQEFLRRESLSGVLIGTVRNFAWVTAGGDNHIVIASEKGAVLLFIRDDGQKFVIASYSDAARVMNEDLRGMGYQLREIAWYGDRAEPGQMTATLQELTGGRPFASDTRYPGSHMVDDELATLRVPLTETEIRKYRWLGRRCAEAVDSVCRKIRPGMTERGVEALVCDALMRHAIRPAVLLIAADERILNYRHAPPSDTKKIEKYAMVNICASRWGLVIAMTRSVHFGPMPEDLEKKLHAAARVNAGFWARTVPGAGAGAILQGAIEDYAAAGYPGEWKRHHQGGAIGYQERDWVAVPGATQKVQANQAFAWNPAIQGVKVEDTILLAGDQLEILSEIRGWPVVESKALGRIYRSPGILVR